jgi:DNA-binding NtrC family response regulator
MQKSILLVDDEDLVRRALKGFLASEDYEVDEAACGEDALRLLNDKYYGLLIIDLKMPGLSGIDVLERLRVMHKKTEVILMTGYGTIDTAVEAIRAGAFDFLAKPIDFERLLVTVRNALEKTTLRHRVDALTSQVQKELDLSKIVGSNIHMLKIFDTIRCVSDNDVNVLITGESGTGKELIARALHVNSKRKEGPFIPVNCVALSENLLESELFGHEKGSFTGATQRKHGYFEAAVGGTIFLDEIGDLPMPLQAKLLRTLQERTIQRVGSTELIAVDVRIVSATNKDLQQCVAQNAFREDLFYRLNVLSLDMPTLRQRKDDLPQLVDHFIRKYTAQMSKAKPVLDPQAEEAIMAYNWPGNIRELENIIQRAVALCENGCIQKQHLPEQLIGAIQSSNRKTAFTGISSFKEAKAQMIDDFERDFLTESLKRYDGNVTRAADAIGLGRTVMQRMLKKHNIESRDYK